MKKLLITLVVFVSCGLISSSASFAEEKEDKEIGNIVSEAAHKAKEEGLKGQDLAAKVHEAIQERKKTRITEKGQKKIRKIRGTNVTAKGKKR